MQGTRIDLSEVADQLYEWTFHALLKFQHYTVYGLRLGKLGRVVFFYFFLFSYWCCLFCCRRHHFGTNSACRALYVLHTSSHPPPITSKRCEPFCHSNHLETRDEKNEHAFPWQYVEASKMINSKKLQTRTVSQKLAIFIAFSLVSPFLA